jgi:hypothetical protein
VAVKEFGGMRAFGRFADLSATLISGALAGKSTSRHMENRLRAALGLEPLENDALVVLHHDERVTKKPGFGVQGKHSHYVVRALRLPVEDARLLDEVVGRAGFRSFSEFWNERGTVENLLRLGLATEGQDGQE